MRTRSCGEAEARRDLTAVDVQPLGRDVQVDPAFAGGHGEARLRAEKRLILDPDLVLAADHDVGWSVRVTLTDPYVPDQVAALVQDRGARGQGRAGVGHRRQHLVAGETTRMESFGMSGSG